MRLVLVTRAVESIAVVITSTALLGSARTPTMPDDTCATATSSAPVSYTTSFGQQQVLSASSAKWGIRLVAFQPSIWPPRQFTFAVKNEKTTAAGQLTFDAWGSSDSLQVNQIDEIHIFGDKLLIIGRAGANSSEADVVELPSGKILDRFPCFMPAVSPGSRFVAFLKSFPGHPGPVSVSAEYLVYSLVDGPASRGAHLRAVYPPGATTAPGGNLLPGLDSPVHWISSERLFWIDADTVAFTDHYPGQDELVLVNLGDAVQAPDVRTETIPADKLIDLDRCRSRYSAADLESISRDPSGLIRVKEIALISKESGYLCLRFDTSPCLTRTEFTVKAPPGPQGR